MSQDDKLHAAGYIKRQTDFIQYNGGQDVFVLNVNSIVPEQREKALENLTRAFETLGSTKVDDPMPKGMAVMTNSKDLSLAQLDVSKLQPFHSQAM